MSLLRFVAGAKVGSRDATEGTEPLFIVGLNGELIQTQNDDGEFRLSLVETEWVSYAKAYVEAYEANQKSRAA